MSTTVPRKNYKLLDAWRGLASLFVVAYHTLAPLSGTYPYAKNTPLFQVGLFGYLGVHVFFVISGYCIASAACSNLRRKESLVPFLKARVRRVYPPMWVAVALRFVLASVAYLLVAKGWLRNSASAAEDMLHRPLSFYIANVTLTNLIVRTGFILDVCWTLCYEIAFYVIVGVALWAVLRRGSERLLLDLLHGITLLSLGILLLVPNYAFYPLDFWPEFGLGVLLYDVLLHPKEYRPKVWLLAACLLTVRFAIVNTYGIGSTLRVGRLPSSAALIFTLLSLILYRYDDNLIRRKPVLLLAWIGGFSYSLYLVHKIPVPLLQQTFKLVKPLHGQFALCLFFALISSTLLAYIFYWFCERPLLSRNAVKRRQEEDTLEVPGNQT